MSIKYIKGNIVSYIEQGYFDIVIHGANCMNTMGSGVARDISDRYPEVFMVDCLTKENDVYKMGTYSCAVIYLDDDKECRIINAYTQFGYGRDKPRARVITFKKDDKGKSVPDEIMTGYSGKQFDSVSFMNILSTIKKEYGNQNKRFGMPRIGCGRGGEKWNVVEKIIELVLSNEDITVVDFKE